MCRVFYFLKGQEKKKPFSYVENPPFYRPRGESLYGRSYRVAKEMGELQAPSVRVAYYWMGFVLINIYRMPSTRSLLINIYRMPSTRS